MQGGSRVPALGFGTFRIQGEDCREAVRCALETGYRHIDTAQAYGNEAEVGAALEDVGLPREQVFLTTKCHKDHLTAPEVARWFDNSLRALRTDHVDLLLIHWPSATTPLGETLDAMRALQATGKVKHIGVSNFPVALLREAVETHKARLFTNQIEYHPLLVQPALNAWTFGRGMLLTGHSPLATGRLVDHPVLAAIGARYGKSASQVAIRWQLEQDKVIVLPKSQTPARIGENFDVFDFALDEADMAAIAALPHDQRGVDPPWAPRWDM